MSSVLFVTITLVGNTAVLAFKVEQITIRRQTDRQTEKKADRYTGERKWTERERERQTDRQRDGQRAKRDGNVFKWNSGSLSAKC